MEKNVTNPPIMPATKPTQPITPQNKPVATSTQNSNIKPAVNPTAIPIKPVSSPANSSAPTSVKAPNIKPTANASVNPIQAKPTTTQSNQSVNLSAVNQIPKPGVAPAVQNSKPVSSANTVNLGKPSDVKSQNSLNREKNISPINSLPNKPDKPTNSNITPSLASGKETPATSTTAVANTSNKTSENSKNSSSPSADTPAENIKTADTKSKENLESKTQLKDNTKPTQLEPVDVVQGNKSSSTKIEKKNKKKDKFANIDDEKSKKHKSESKSKSFSFSNFISCLFIIITFTWMMLCIVFMVDIFVSKDINILGYSVICSNDDNLSPKIPDGSICLYSTDITDIKEGNIIVYFDDKDAYCLGTVYQCNSMNYLVIAKDGNTISVGKDKVDGVYIQNLETLQVVIEFVTIKHNAIIFTVAPFVLVLFTQLILHLCDRKLKNKKNKIEDVVDFKDDEELIENKNSKEVKLEQTSKETEKLKSPNVLNPSSKDVTPENSVAKTDENKINKDSVKTLQDSSNMKFTNTQSVLVDTKNNLNDKTDTKSTLAKPVNNTTSNTLQKAPVKPTPKPVENIDKQSSTPLNSTKKSTSATSNVTIKLGSNSGPSKITVKQGGSNSGAITISLDPNNKKQPAVNTQTAKPTLSTASGAKPATSQQNSNIAKPNANTTKPIPSDNGKK